MKSKLLMRLVFIAVSKIFAATIFAAEQVAGLPPPIVGYPAPVPNRTSEEIYNEQKSRNYYFDLGAELAQDDPVYIDSSVGDLIEKDTLALAIRQRFSQMLQKSEPLIQVRVVINRAGSTRQSDIDRLCEISVRAKIKCTDPGVVSGNQTTVSGKIFASVSKESGDKTGFDYDFLIIVGGTDRSVIPFSISYAVITAVDRVRNPNFPENFFIRDGRLAVFKPDNQDDGK